jgi:hypothetical protein
MASYGGAGRKLKAPLSAGPPKVGQLGRANRRAFVKCLKFSTFFGSCPTRIDLVQQLVIAPGLALRGHLTDDAIENAEQFRSGLRRVEQQALGMQFPEAPVLNALTPLFKQLGAAAARTFAQRRQQIA